jgi:hypothetical protein
MEATELKTQLTEEQLAKLVVLLFNRAMDAGCEDAVQAATDYLDDLGYNWEV